MSNKKEQRHKKNRQELQPQRKSSQDRPLINPNEILGRNSNSFSNDESVLMEFLHQQESYSGPFPHPKYIKEWEETLPGCADRILSMTENQSSHRQKLEEKAVFSGIKAAQYGQRFAFIIAMTVIIGAMGLIFVGREISGFTTLMITLATLVGLFIYGRKSGQNEMKEKMEKLEDAAKNRDLHPDIDELKKMLAQSDES